MTAHDTRRTRSEKPSRTQAIGRHVHATIMAQQSRYIAGDSRAAATLAKLRAAATTPLGQSPESWAPVFTGLPDDIIGHGDIPNRAEKAIHAAIGLWALHQQSQSTPMHVAKHGETTWNRTGFGHALRKLASPNDVDEFNQGVLRRFRSIVSAVEFDAILYHCRGLITMLRAAKVPLDYGQLAKDLYLLQNPEAANGVRLRWGRELYSSPPRAAADTDEQKTTPAGA